MLWSILAAIAFYLGALNTILARVAGTCTQGDADRLWGVWLSIALYGGAILTLARARFLRVTLAACAPVAAVLLWQLAFSVRFALGVAAGKSACEMLEGYGPMRHSGDEAVLALLWLGMALLVPAGVALACRRRQFTR